MRFSLRKKREHMAAVTEEQILEALKPVMDPEIGIGIVDLGLIYRIDIDDSGRVEIDMTMTAMGCPYGEVLLGRVRETVEKIEGVTKAVVNLVWEPIWHPDERCSDEAKDKLGLW